MAENNGINQRHVLINESSRRQCLGNGVIMAGSNLHGVEEYAWRQLSMAIRLKWRNVYVA